MQRSWISEDKHPSKSGATKIATVFLEQDEKVNIHTFVCLVDGTWQHAKKQL